MGRGDPLRQILAFDEFHHEGGHAAALFESVDGRDVRMIQRGEGLGFAGEPGEAFGIVGERLREDLDRDVTIELGITRPKDLAHAPATDEIGQLEDAETGAGSQSQTVEV